MKRLESKMESDSNCRATRDAASIWKAAIAAVHGQKLVSDFVTFTDETIEFGRHSVSIHDAKTVCMVAAGKAASAMAAGFLEKLEGSQFERTGRLFGQVNIPRNSLIDTKQKELLQKFQIKINEVRPANVNLPTQAAVNATRSIRSMVNSLEPSDLCVVLLSGGGSALLTEPKDPVTLAEKLDTIEFLFANNADIVDVNRIRAMLSEVKQGGLVRDCPSRNIVTLLISDIIGDPIQLIAGGPTVIQSDDREAVRDIARRYDPEENVFAKSIWKILHRNHETTQSVDRAHHAMNANPVQVRHFVLANNETAVAAAASCAAKLGYQVTSETVVESQSAEEAGNALIDRLRVVNGKHCIISGGEPTVQLASPEVRGTGGRNQQLVLAALQQAMSSELKNTPGWCLFSAGTDGQDGVSSAAGAWADADVIGRAMREELDAGRSLIFNNANEFFRRAGGIFKCDATHTNVCDLRIAIRNSV